MFTIVCYTWLLARLFVKVPQPGHNYVTFSVFESRYYLLLPV